MIKKISNTVRVRFAPSPTGNLHIGSARTALFNWLFARHHGGKFFLRIEDTDKERSRTELIEPIYETLSWLGLTYDDEVVIQSKRFQRHQEVAYDLLMQGKAYKCFATPEELEKMRQEALSKGLPVQYNKIWRDQEPDQSLADAPYTVRLKANPGSRIINDLVQGLVEVKDIDDMVLLRSDGSPTYMLSVVVDDHDMEITHIIRGDDHLNNAFRQAEIYQACGWEVPEFAHIPLIHAEEGHKLSKRNNDAGVDFYKAQGILPEALSNYLLRMGWSHGNDEIISREQAIAWFDLAKVGKSSARLNWSKLIFLNQHYLKTIPEEDLIQRLLDKIEEIYKIVCSDPIKGKLLKGLAGLKVRAENLNDLAANSMIYAWDSLAIKPVLTAVQQGILKAYKEFLTPELFTQNLLDATKAWCQGENIALKDLAEALRWALTGHKVSPSIFEVMEILGWDLTCQRLLDVL